MVTIEIPDEDIELVAEALAERDAHSKDRIGDPGEWVEEKLMRLVTGAVEAKVRRDLRDAAKEDMDYDLPDWVEANSNYAETR